MGTRTSTFKRYEKKYMLNHRQYVALRELIKAHTKPDQYDHYTICNIYYDTDNYAIIRRSIEKPVYKEKLRIRSYGMPSDEDTIFFELKKKYKKEVFKRRVSLSVSELQSYLSDGIIPDVSQQVLDEIAYFMAMYKPIPKIFIAYERSALVGLDDTSLRITFDQNIRFREDQLSLTSGDFGMKILDDNKYLMEIKIVGAMPLWLSRTLNKLNIYPRSFSKYGYCFQNYMHAKSAIIADDLTRDATKGVNYVRKF